MSPAIASSMTIVAYLALFAAVGVFFLFVNLLVGKFLRPDNPSPEKNDIYECGEPTIGSSFVQFDLRFYVVALVFIVFDVEVAFLFPIATVFGKANHLENYPQPLAVAAADGSVELSPAARDVYRELGVPAPSIDAADAAAADAVLRRGAKNLVWFAAGAIGLFFFILIAGFAYEWKTGSLDWVRSIAQQSADALPPEHDIPADSEAVLSA